jgi:hypothetical protein
MRRPRHSSCITSARSPQRWRKYFAPAGAIYRRAGSRAGNCRNARRCCRSGPDPAAKDADEAERTRRPPPPFPPPAEIHSGRPQTQAPAILPAVKDINAVSSTAEGRAQIVVCRNRRRKEDDAIDAARRQRFGGCQNYRAAGAMGQEINFLVRISAAAGCDSGRQSMALAPRVLFIHLIGNHLAITMRPGDGFHL